jgi:hypothetical protein
MLPVWPYLTPALTALYLGNQKPAKKSHMGVYGPGSLMCVPHFTGFTLVSVCGYTIVSILDCYYIENQMKSRTPVSITRYCAGKLSWMYVCVRVITD